MDDPSELAAARLQIARLEALRQYPQADPELIGELTDPSQIARVAERDHARAQQFAQQQRQGTAPSPNPPAGSDPAAGEKEAQLRRWRTQVKHNQLRKQIDLTDAEMAQNEFFKSAWNDHMEQRRNGGKPTLGRAS